MEELPVSDINGELEFRLVAGGSSSFWQFWPAPTGAEAARGEESPATGSFWQFPLCPGGRCLQEGGGSVLGLFQQLPRLKLHFQRVFPVFPAIHLGLHRVQKRLIAGAAGVKLRHVFVEHLDRRVYLPVQGGLMAQGFVQPVQALVLGQRLVLKELRLPAVQAAQTPGSGGDFFDVVAFQQVAGGKLGDEFGFDCR